MKKFSKIAVAASLLAGLVTTSLPAWAAKDRYNAEDGEVQQYFIFVEGRGKAMRVGTMQINFQTQPNDVLVARTQSVMRLEFGGQVIMDAKSQSVEAWQGDLFVQMNAQALNKGDKATLKAQTYSSGRVKIETDGNENTFNGMTEGPAIPGSIWNKASLSAPSVFDASFLSGHSGTPEVKKMGTSTIKVGKQKMECTKYRLKSRQADGEQGKMFLWYANDTGRLCRAEAKSKRGNMLWKAVK